MQMQPDISVNIGNLKLKNPVMTASGTFGYGTEFKDLVDLNQLGAIIVKGLSLNPSRGNPPPRIVETACGMLNAIGLENVGLADFLTYKLPFLRKFATPLIINIYGETIDEYAQVAARLNEVQGISGLEINISCPNVKQGGIAFGADAKSAFKVVSAVRKATVLPLMVKLSPNVTDIRIMAKSAQEAGADSLSLINTITGMAIDIKSRKPCLANITGGLSGPAIKPVALRMVWQVANAVSIPIVGVGGIMDATDAIEFLIAGATAVQVGTANFVNSRATLDIIDGLKTYLLDNQIKQVKDLVGSLKV